MVDGINYAQFITSQQVAPDREIDLIDIKEIKAILYLGLRGNIALPEEEHEVDILV